MYPHPEQYRDLMRQRMAEQHRHAERRDLLRRAASSKASLSRALSRSVARTLFRAAFALDSSAVWNGLWEKLSSTEPRTNRERRTG